MIDNLVKDLSELKEVRAIALGGSRATNLYQKDSDYDLYIYLDNDIEEDRRKKVIDPYVSYMEYSNAFWELEDDGVLKSGVEIELIYRKVEEFQNSVKECSISIGYSTCFIDNVLSSVILYEKDEYLTILKKDLKESFHDDCFKEIIDFNYPLIKDRIPALLNQYNKASKRNDYHSINHRLAEYFAIYYDIIYAINKEFHKGEKRMMEITEKFEFLPSNSSTLIKEVYENAFSNKEISRTALKKLSENLEDLIKKIR